MYINSAERIFFKGANIFSKIFYRIIDLIPYFNFIKHTRNTQTPISFSTWFNQKILGKNRSAYWPVSSKSIVTNPKNIYAGIETSPGLMPGCYIQGLGKIYIGDYTQIAANVGIISANHELYDNRHHIYEEVRIGKYCWIGMGAISLPGVIIGDNTIVAAGSVVTKSFPEGYCVIGGNPARVLKTLDKDLCVKHRSHYEYYGYIPANKFEKFRSRHLNVNQW
jgi:acetyltransferase-like isoleucine patch superfamily enzyme